jgi:site-specific recombinase XerD
VTTSASAPRDAGQLVGLDFDQPTVIVRVMLTPDRAIDDFLGDCRRRRWSERSIHSYAATLYAFADRLPIDTDVSKITADDVRRYLATRSHLAPGTVAGHEAHLSSWFKWLFKARKISRNPIDEIERTKRIPAEDLDVVTIPTADVPLLLERARVGAERNAVAIAAYLGPRRRAIALLRRRDYDRDRQLMRFREKGAKAILKPVPDELAVILEGSIARGEILAAPADYLVPPEGYLSRRGERDDRVVWRIIRRVAERAGVDAHVHALRAAFAVFYLERNPDDLLGLKELLGHRSLNTTLIYLRRLNKQAAMENVRSLSWAATGSLAGAAWLSQSPPTALESSSGVGAGGFEPPSEDSPRPERRGGEHDPLAALFLRLNRLRTTDDGAFADLVARVEQGLPEVE